MNIARKLVNELKEILSQSWLESIVYTTPEEEINKIISALQDWIEKHEEMFDHSHFKIHDKKKIDEWMAYHNKVMQE